MPRFGSAGLTDLGITPTGVEAIIPTYLERYRDESGAAILLASHNMGEVERLCSTVLMMRGGRIVDRGAPEALIQRYGRRTLEEVFLDIARRRDGSEGAEAAQ